MTNLQTVGISFSFLRRLFEARRFLWNFSVHNFYGCICIEGRNSCLAGNYFGLNWRILQFFIISWTKQNLGTYVNSKNLMRALLSFLKKQLFSCTYVCNSGCVCLPEDIIDNLDKKTQQIKRKDGYCWENPTLFNHSYMNINTSICNHHKSQIWH